MLSHDSKMRCSVIDLYFTMFGKKRPACLPPPILPESSVTKLGNFDEVLKCLSLLIRNYFFPYFENIFR